MPTSAARATQLWWSAYVSSLSVITSTTAGPPASSAAAYAARRSAAVAATRYDRPKPRQTPSKRWACGVSKYGEKTAECAIGR